MCVCVCVYGGKEINVHMLCRKCQSFQKSFCKVSLFYLKIYFLKIITFYFLKHIAFQSLLLYDYSEHKDTRTLYINLLSFSNSVSIS